MPPVRLGAAIVLVIVLAACGIYGLFTRIVHRPLQRVRLKRARVSGRMFVSAIVPRSLSNMSTKHGALGGEQSSAVAVHNIPKGT